MEYSPALYHYPVLGSTNTEAKRLLQEEAVTSPFVVQAGEQHEGRGRYGRVWQSPPGNLYMTLVTEAGQEETTLACLPYIAGLALQEAIGAPCQLKWPNDALIAGKKVAGILMEKQGRHVLIGIGVNVTRAPREVIYPAGSLHEAGIMISADRLRQAIVERFYLWQERIRKDGFLPIREAWHSVCCHLDGLVTVGISRDNPEEKLEGRCIGVDDCGQLILEVNGEMRYISTGDVFL